MIGGYLNKNESTMLWSAGLTKIGDQATIWRDYTHVSTMYPRPHTDAIFAICVDKKRYMITDKVHVE